MEVSGLDIHPVFLPGMGLVWAYKSPISAVAHYHLLAVVYGSALIESFAGLVQILLFRALPDSFVEVGASIFWALISFSEVARYWQGITTTARGHYQKPPIYTFKQ